MSRSKTIAPARTAAALVGPAAALGCPDCATARVVRASVFDADFWIELGLVSLPLLGVGFVSALLYRIGMRPTAHDTSMRIRT